MIRTIFLWVAITLPATGLMRCAPDGMSERPDPSLTLIEYRQLRNDWKLKEAYDMLADTCKSFITEENFIKYNEVPDSVKDRQVYTMVSMDTLPVFGYPDFSRFRVGYQYVDSYAGDTIDGEWEYSLVFENGKWKILWYSRVLDVAIASLQNQQYEQALRLFRVITAVNPFDDAALRGLALTYANLSETVQAITAAERMVELKPDDPANLTLLGDLYGSVEAYEQSIDMYQKAIRLNPSPMYYVNLGSFYKFNEQYVEADESYRMGLELDSLMPQAWWMLGELYYYDLEDRESAKAFYRKALDLPEMEGHYQLDLYYNYALLLYNESVEEKRKDHPETARKLLSEARTYIGKALDGDPRNTDYSFLMNEINNATRAL